MWNHAFLILMMKLNRLLIILVLLFLSGCKEEFYEDSTGYKSPDYRDSYDGIYYVTCSFVNTSGIRNASADIEIQKRRSDLLQITLYSEAYEMINDDGLMTGYSYLVVDSNGNFIIKEFHYEGSGRFTENTIEYQYLHLNDNTYCDCFGVKK